MLVRKVEHLEHGATLARQRARHVHLAEDQLRQVDRHRRLGQRQQHKRAVVGGQGDELVPFYGLAQAYDEEEFDRVDCSLELLRSLGAFCFVLFCKNARRKGISMDCEEREV